MQNKFDNIPIPERLDEVVTSSMKEIRKIKNRRLRNKVIAASAATVIAIGGIGITNPAIASKLPIIGEIFSQVEKKITFSGDYSSLAKKVDVETQSSEGLDVTVAEVYCDGYSAYITLEMNYKDELGKIPRFPLNVDESESYESVNCEAKAWIEGSDQEKMRHTLKIIEGSKTGPNSFAGVLKVDLDKVASVDDEYNLKLNLRQVLIQSLDRGGIVDGYDNPNGYLVSGPWDFNIPITVDKENVKEIEINEKNDLGFGLKSVVVTPFQIIVDHIIPEELDKVEFQYGVGIAVFNDKGEAMQYCNPRQVKKEESEETLFSVEQKDISELHIYMASDSVKTIKQKDENETKKRAIYSKTIKVK